MGQFLLKHFTECSQVVPFAATGPQIEKLMASYTSDTSYQQVILPNSQYQGEQSGFTCLKPLQFDAGAQSAFPRKTPTKYSTNAPWNEAYIGTLSAPSTPLERPMAALHEQLGCLCDLFNHDQEHMKSDYSSKQWKHTS